MAIVLGGTLTGALATVAINAAMLAAQRIGAMSSQPPQEVVERGREATPTPLAALVICATSCFGRIPAPPTNDRPGRALTMLVAHLVYGLSLAILWRAALPSRRNDR